MLLRIMSYIYIKHSQLNSREKIHLLSFFCQSKVKAILTFSILSFSFQVKKLIFLKNLYSVVYIKNSHPINRIVFCFHTYKTDDSFMRMSQQLKQ